MILLILSATVVAGQDLYIPALNSTHEYSVDRRDNIVSYQWEVYSDATLTTLATESEATLTPLGIIGDKHKVEVTWKATGVYFLLITVTDNAGCTNKMAWRFEVENQAPVALDDNYTINIASGNTLKDNLSSNDSDPNGGNLIYNTIPAVAPTFGTVAIQADGTFTYTADGNSYNGITDRFTYEVCDDQNPSKCSTAEVTVVIDNVAPAVPVVNSLATNNFTPSLTGTVVLETGETFSVTVGRTTYKLETDPELSVTGDNWTLNVSEVLAEGRYNVVARVRDAAGNESTDITSDELTIDLTAPVVPTVNELTTADTTPTITGTVTFETSGQFTVTVNGIPYTYGSSSALTVSGNDWSLTIPDAKVLDIGDYDVEARVTDRAGNQSTDVTTNELTIINSLVKPTVDNLTTSNQSPTLTGTVNYISGDLFKVIIKKGEGDYSYEYSYDYKVNPELTISGGRWSLNVPQVLDEGVHNIIAQHTDGLGNVLEDETINELIVVLSTENRPTVYGLTTADTTPIIRGDVNLATGDGFSVRVDRKTYALGTDSELTVTGRDWALQIPAGRELAVGVYDVVATRINGEGRAVTDNTDGELNIVSSSTIIDLAITKSSEPRVIIGDTIYYDLRVENLGDVPMKYVLVEDELSGMGLGMAKYRVKGEQSWDDAKNWSGKAIIPSLGVNESKTLQLRAFVVPQTDRTINNVAWVNKDYASEEINALNNTSNYATELYNGVEAIIRPGSDTICVNQLATLSARLSKGLNLAFTWNITASPGGSTFQLNNISRDDVTFTADTPGDYTLELQAQNTVLGYSHKITANIHIATVQSIIEGFHPVTEALYYPQVNDVAIYGAENEEGERTWPRLDGTQSLGLGNTYLWTSDEGGAIADGNVTDLSVTVGAEGVYQLKVVNRFGCEDQAQVTVGKRYHPIGAPRDTVIQEDAIITFNVFPNRLQYPGDSLVFDADGDYKYTSDAINIVNAPNSETDYGTVIYDEQNRLLQYTQSKPINNQQQQDEIRLVITDQYDLPSNEFAVNITIEPRPFIIPNAFSPNGDGINDKFIIEGITKDEFAQNSIEIINRWGGKVFSASNYDNENNVWDGSANVGGTVGAGELPTGTYYYVLRISGNSNVYTGWVYLDR